MGHDLTAYRRSIDALFARTTGKSKFGLERTEALLRALGDPHRSVEVLHVAGTNGKGSTCATLEAVLRGGGRRVGRYTSPHLVDFRERFLVDGQAIEPEYVVEFVRRWTPLVEELGATFFEATTAMAFAYFVAREIDVAIVEVGLGGRLDSTNVVHPLVAGVTSIGIDHVEQLGETKQSIAREKAGIFKRGAAAVIGERDRDVSRLLREVAAEHGASPIVDVWDALAPEDVVVSALGTEFTIHTAEGSQRLATPLAGEHQAGNAATALAMLRAAGGANWPGWTVAAQALRSVRLPGRFHREGPFIFDVAHNPDGAAVLARTIADVKPGGPLVAVLCVLEDKDWRGVMHALRPVVTHFVLTQAPTAPASRSWDLPTVARFARDFSIEHTVIRDFDAALARARSIGGTVLVTGSFHTVGDAMDRLQVDPLAG